MEESIVKAEVLEIQYLTPVMDLATAKARLQQFQEFVKGYLVEGINEDYGVIPGTKKPTLLKPGADKLCELYGLSDEYDIVPEQSREEWERTPPLFDYTIRCTLRSNRNGGLVSTGLGSCNSYEARYRWRESARKCPKCGKENIIKGQEQYGGGWLCWAKKGGCGAKFKDEAPEIVGQVSGRVENDDIASLKNTILKMAKKRAKIDATLSATRSSGIFTQDMDDIPLGDTNGHTMPPAQPQVASEKAKPEPISGLVSAFNGIGVTAEMLSSRLGRDIGTATPEEISILRQTYKDIKAGKAKWTPQPGEESKITKAQLPVFWGSVKGAGWSEEEAHRVLMGAFGFRSVLEIPQLRLDEIIVWFQQHKPVGQQEMQEGIPF